MGAAAQLAIGAAVGVATGMVFFGGLLWTVQRLPRARRPELLAGLSFLMRFGFLGAALVVLAVTFEGPGPVVASAGGLLGARSLLVRRARAGLEA